MIKLNINGTPSSTMSVNGLGLRVRGHQATAAPRFRPLFSRITTLTTITIKLLSPLSKLPFIHPYQCTLGDDVILYETVLLLCYGV